MGDVAAVYELTNAGAEDVQLDELQIGLNLGQTIVQRLGILESFNSDQTEKMISSDGKILSQKAVVDSADEVRKTMEARLKVNYAEFGKKLLKAGGNVTGNTNRW